MEAVISTPELFESIMENLDMATILTSVQRVCKDWKRRIDASSSIQTLIYLRPDNGDGLFGSCKVNPLLLKHFGPILQRKADDFIGLEPRLRFRCERGYLDIRTLESMHLSIAAMGHGRIKHERFVRKEASWRRMLVSQPPPRAVASINFGDNGRWERRSTDTPVTINTLPEGLRMGQLWDTVYHALWSPYTGSVEKRWVITSWRVGGDDVAPENSWTNMILPSLRERVEDTEAEFLIAQVELHYDEAECAQWHNHRIRAGRYNCLDDRARYFRARRRGSTSWMFRSQGYNEKKTLLRTSTSNLLDQ